MKNDNELTSQPSDLPSRRRLLKGMIAGGSGLSAVAVAPERWARPIVSSVILPAHAKASVGAVAVPESCAHDSTTITETDESGRDDIFIIYDGVVSCDILIGDVSTGTQIPANTVIVIDSDQDDVGEFLLWDGDDDIGSNWNRTGRNYNDDNNTNGTYFIDVARAGNPASKFRVSFRVNISGVLGNISMTVDNVVITAI